MPATLEQLQRWAAAVDLHEICAMRMRTVGTTMTSHWENTEARLARSVDQLHTWAEMEAHFTTARMAEREDNKWAWEEYWDSWGGRGEAELGRRMFFGQLVALANDTPGVINSLASDAWHPIMAWDDRAIKLATFNDGLSLLVSKILRGHAPLRKDNTNGRFSQKSENFANYRQIP